MTNVLTSIRTQARAGARVVARKLDRWSSGRLTPAMVTWFGFLMHVPIAYLIATEHNLWAAAFLVFFGLFDILDGGLAAVQERTSPQGMLLDASTDRMKEVLLYTGAAFALISSGHPKTAVWAVVACGASICVSYVKAKGEAAVASGKKQIPHTVLNRMFGDGLVTFEIRMAILTAGLIFDQLYPAVLVIAVAASFTAFQRLYLISKALGKH